MVVETKGKYTYQDYVNAPEDTRYELIHGELIERASGESRAHQKAVGALGYRTNAFAEKYELGEVYLGPRDMVLSDTNVVQPEVIFISNERLSIDTAAEIWGAPDLVAEVLSPSTARRDLTVKRDLYERHGVGEYWLVDTEDMSITVLLLGERGYETVAVYGYDDTLQSPTLPGLGIALSEVF